MCVIMQVFKDRPTDGMVDKAWDTNKHGGGVAWQDVDEQGEGWCYWKKGLDLEDMRRYIKDLPMPFVAHFRVASSGGICDELTHPFPVDPDTSLDLEGKTKGYVLFHNGDWKEWRERMVQVSCNTGYKIPMGKYSDSRAMAWISSILGLGFVDMIGMRGVAISPDDIELFEGDGWKQILGVNCSNDRFWFNFSNGPICKYGQCQNKGNLDSDRNCMVHCERGQACKTHRRPTLPSQTDAASGGVIGLPPFVDLTKEFDFKLGPALTLENFPDPKDRGGIGSAIIELGKSNLSVDVLGNIGGTQPPDPFVIVRIAERLHETKKISKNLLKEIRKRFTGTPHYLEAASK